MTPEVRKEVAERVLQAYDVSTEHTARVLSVLYEDEKERGEWQHRAEEAENILDHALCDRDRWKKRAEAMGRAMIYANITCKVCVNIDNDPVSDNPCANCFWPDRNNFTFNESRFSGDTP
jgi:hypothetical protein